VIKRYVFGLVIVISMLWLNDRAVCDTKMNSGPETQKPAMLEALRVYLDCNYCDLLYIRKNIPFVSFTRDPELAQVHVIVSINRTGSGGFRYNLKFIGREDLADIEQQLDYTSSQSDSRLLRNKGLTQILKMGLMPFVARTGNTSNINIDYDSENGGEVAREGKDPWNAWIFYIDSRGSVEMEESQQELSFENSLRANRTTDKWKFRSELDNEYDEENYEDDGNKIKSILRETELDILLVKSLNSQWSVGFLGGARTTTFRNFHLKYEIAPAIEYNFFPWDLLDQKILTIGYHAGFQSFHYIEETVFGKMKENLMFEALRFELELRQPWGEVDTRLTGSHYFQDLDLYGIELSSSIAFRITKGLMFRLHMDANSIHDQIYLAKGDASLEEILLKRKQLSTQYDLEFGVGIRYSFGSIYNNVVNRRM